MRNQGVNGDANDRAKVSVSVSSGGGSLEVQGIAAGRLGEVLADLLSPLSQGLGWVGDKFSDARRSSAMRAALKAKKMLAEEGISTGNVPPKILLPWLEGASLETEETSTLSDMWAGLLARAVKSADAVNISYIETLKRIGKREAELLHFFATDTSPQFSTKFYGDGIDGFSAEQNPLLDGYIGQLDKYSSSTDLRAVLETFFIQFMSQIILYSVDGASVRRTHYFDENEHVISNLEQLGLIEIRRKNFRSTAHSFEFVWFEITKYAFDFFWACEGVKTGGGLEALAGLPKLVSVGEMIDREKSK